MITHFLVNSQFAHPAVKAIIESQSCINQTVSTLLKLNDANALDIRFLKVTDRFECIIGGYFGGVGLIKMCHGDNFFNFEMPMIDSCLIESKN